MSVVLGRFPAAAAALPGGWCGPGEVPTDRPDVVAGNQVHVVYAYPAGAPDRFGEFVGRIVRDLAGVDEWWRSQDPFRTPRFDLAAFPGCDSEFGALDVSSVAITETDENVDTEVSGSASRIVYADFFRNGLDERRRSTSSTSTFRPSPACAVSPGAARCSSTSRASFVFLQVPPGCEIGGWGSGNGWPTRTAAHELLHALNDSFAPGTAPNACPDMGHVCDSQADVLSTGTVHPSSRLARGPRRRERLRLLRPPGTVVGRPRLRVADAPRDGAGVAHRVGGRQLRRGKVVVDPGGVVCADTCTRRFDAGAPPRVTVTPLGGSTLIRWEGACTGLEVPCSPTVGGADTHVTAVLGQAVIVAGTCTRPRRRPGRRRCV